MKKLKFYECESMSHVLGVLKFDDEPQIYIEKYETPGISLSIFQRIRLAIGYIVNPEKYEIHGDIILSNKTARKLARDLLKMTEK